MTYLEYLHFIQNIGCSHTLCLLNFTMIYFEYLQFIQNIGCSHTLRLPNFTMTYLEYLHFIQNNGCSHTYFALSRILWYPIWNIFTVPKTVAILCAGWIVITSLVNVYFVPNIGFSHTLCWLNFVMRLEYLQSTTNIDCTHSHTFCWLNFVMTLIGISNTYSYLGCNHAFYLLNFVMTLIGVSTAYSKHWL